MKHGRILSYFFLTPLLLLVSIALTIINIFSACLFDYRAGQINPGTFGTALTFRSSGHSSSLMILWCCISDSMFVAQSFSLSFGLSKSPFQFSQSSVSRMLADVLSSSLSTGWRLTLRIRRTLNIWVSSLARFFFRHRWRQRRSFWKFGCSCTIRLKECPGYFDNLFRVQNVSHGSRLLILSARFFLGSM